MQMMPLQPDISEYRIFTKVLEGPTHREFFARVGEVVAGADDGANSWNESEEREILDSKYYATFDDHFVQGWPICGPNIV